MIKLNLLLLFLTLLSISSNAQTKKWSLQECIDYGVEESLAMERQLLSNKIDLSFL